MKMHFGKIAISTLLVSTLAAPTTILANNDPIHSTENIITSTQFNDVKADHWAFEAIQWAQSKGFVSGYGDGRFGPNDTLSEAQFAKMISNYFNIKDTYGDLNKTTKAAHWSDSDYDALAQYAVPLNGYFDNTIRNKPIKRGLVAQVLTYVAGYSTNLTSSIEFLLDNNVTSGQYPQFKDKDLNKFFGVNNNLTRSQVVAFLYRMEMEQLNTISESIDRPNGKSINDTALIGQKRVDNILREEATPKDNNNNTKEPQKPSKGETKLPIKEGAKISDEANKKLFSKLSDSTVSSLKSKGYEIIVSDKYKDIYAVNLSDDNENHFSYTEETVRIGIVFPAKEKELGAKFVNEILGTKFSSSDFSNIVSGKALSKSVYVQTGFGSSDTLIVSYKK